MRLDGIYLAGAASCLPARLDVAAAVARGDCDGEVARQADLVSVSVTDGSPAPELAAVAGLRAVARSGLQPLALDLLVHATVYYQGHDLWAPASYIQRRTGGRGLAIEIKQMSNGAMAGLELAATHLLARPASGGVLVTTGDVFAPPGFDRWHSDPGTIYADGGTAIVVSRRAGFAALRSVATVSDPALETMHRGEDPFGAVPFAVRRPLDLEVCKRAYLAGAGLGSTVSRVAAGQSEALKRALADAGVSFADIDHLVLPHLGLRRLRSAYLRPLDVPVERTTWEFARSVGHLGAGDQLAGLAHLVETGAVRPGQRCLLAGVGAGYTWSCAVVEILDLPNWV